MTVALPIDIDGFARARQLPVGFLRDGLGLEDVQGGGIRIPYYDPAGNFLFTRTRDVPGRGRFDQPKGTRLEAYGSWRLDEAQRQGGVYLVEGESDCWTLWHHKIPALGLPGTGAAKTLRAEHLDSIDSVYVVEENDQGGPLFVRGILQQLQALNYTGDVYRLALPAGVKDPCEMHLLDPPTFKARWLEVARKARKVEPQPPPPAPASHATNGQQPANQSEPEPFPEPIPASKLRKVEANARWLWQGCLARGSITLMSALWKAGKSTLLAHLLRALERGGSFCDMRATACKILYVTEEPEDIWADRRDDLGIADHTFFLPQPFMAKPRWERWQQFLFHLKAIREHHPYELLVLDTISNLWPVRDENDNAQVQSAVMPLRTLGPDVSLLLLHHLRKGDGQEATASRGAGALTAFVDTILELRRYQPGDRKDRRRVLAGYGRFRDTPDEVVLELAEDGQSYRTHGDRAETVKRDIVTVLDTLLPSQPPGLTYTDITDKWPEDTVPKRERLLATLNANVDGGTYRREGQGRRGSPYTYWCAAGGNSNQSSPVSDAQPVSFLFPVPSPIGTGTGNRNETGDGTANQADVETQF